MNVLFLYIIVPLIVANVVHMIVVKKGLFLFLTVPVSRRLFGANKTWRGFVIVPVLNAILVVVVNGLVLYFPAIRAMSIGFLLGMAYMLSELPNSYLKRRLGIAPGGSAGRHRQLFMLLDKTDSSCGVSLASWFLLHLSLWQVLELLVLSVVTHVVFSWLLVITRIKKSF